MKDKIGLDIDLEELKEGKEKYLGVVLADAFKLPFKTKSFSFVLIPCMTCLLLGLKPRVDSGLITIPPDIIEVLILAWTEYAKYEVIVKTSCDNDVRKEISEYLSKFLANQEFGHVCHAEVDHILVDKDLKKIDPKLILKELKKRRENYLSE